MGGKFERFHCTVETRSPSEDSRLKRFCHSNTPFPAFAMSRLSYILPYLDLELAEREVFISDLIILCSCADWFLRLLDGQQRKKVNFVLKLKHLKLKYICIQIKVLCKYAPLRIIKMQNDHADIVIAALLQSLST